MNHYLSNPLVLLATGPVLLMGVALLVLLAVQVRQYACHLHDLRFKRELVERGLGVDEIERLLAVKNNS